MFLLTMATILTNLAPVNSGLWIYPDNPYAFIYNGKRCYLIGSSMESSCQPTNRPTFHITQRVAIVAFSLYTLTS